MPIALHHKFKLTRAITQRVLAPRNHLNQIKALDNPAAYRARKSVQNYILGDHVTDVKYVQEIAKRRCDPGRICEILKEISQPSGIDAYKGLMITPSSAIKTRSYWRKHVYIYIFHVQSYVRDFIAGITTLDAEEELLVLAIFHCQNENQQNYVKFLELFKTHFPNLMTSDHLAVSTDGDKCTFSSVGGALPNAILMRWIFYLLQNVSTNKLDLGLRQHENTVYRPTERGFLQSLPYLEAFRDAFDRTETLDVQT